MRVVLREIRRLLGNDNGLETVEYAIISGLITGLSLGTIAAIGAWIAMRMELMQSVLGA